MALFQVNNFEVKGIAAAVPELKYDNLNYDWIPKEERELFVRTTGIRYRHVSERSVTTSDLCEHAAKRLMKELSWDKSSIDLLVFVSQTRDYHLPATSCILQDKLQLSKSCLAFDVSMGCSGYVNGLSIVGNMMSSGGLKRALLLVGDVTTDYTSYKDKTSFPLFGDAGTATAIEYKEGETTFFSASTNGAKHEAIILRDAGCRNSVSESSLVEREVEPNVFRNRIQLELDGLEIFQFSLKEVPKDIKQLLEYASVNLNEIDYFILHQANKLINESIRKKLKVSEEKFPMSIHEYGNTSSASIPLTILTRLTELSNKKRKLLLSGFGVGLAWSSAIINMGDIVMPEVIKVKQ